MMNMITPNELARHLGVNPKTLRAWLRSQKRHGNPLVTFHVHNERWFFTSDVAAELAHQYRSR